ncbi:stealth conserved region 3 domain-containing protein, partial [Ilumatobacter sp.]|uniref:stealth conserved region 3 domain-containing protein n=1 Tax=Ilumatobacter sp. TaxID=1967498 RepID=UPI003C40F247
LDELRYSLRSVWEHVPYARHIYIVTDGQVPPWLDTADPRITIVEHASIFEDPSALPTFNSHAIETQLHHIDGLADHYLYLNDDVFFGRTSDWATYFERCGTSHFFPSTALFPVGELHATDKSVDHAGRNLQLELFREFGWAPRNKLIHTPHPQQRQLLIEAEQRFDDRYRATMHARFRSTGDVSFAAALHHRYAQVTGRASVGNLAYEYLALESDNVADHLARLRSASFDTLCLNDGEMTHQQQADVRPLLADFLNRRFPYPAPWEIDGALRSHPST